MESTWSPLLLSLRAAALAVLLLSPPAIAAALLLRGWHGQRRAVADLLLLSPLVLPPTVLGFLLLQLLGPQGPLGRPLQTIGISVVFSWSATVISAAVVAFPLMYRSTLASLEQLDPALEAVALGLGCSPVRAFWRVTLPLIRPGLLAGLSLSFARALGEFGTTMMLAGNIPGRTQTLPLAIYSAVENGSLPLAWQLTAVVLLLNGSCLALVELLSRSRSAPQAPRSPAADHAVDELWVPAEPISLSKTRSQPQLQVAIELRKGTFELALNWSSQAARRAVLGPSGSGKSLLLRCIAGLERPQSCRIQLGQRLLCDTDRGVWVAPQHRRIAMVFQQHALFPHLTVAANVAFGLDRLSREQRRTQVGQLLAAVGLQDQALQFAHQLSGGQCQRVALARALAVKPDLLLLDEPLSSQDSFRRRRLQQWMEDLQRSTGTPILLVTHDIDEAHRLSDELLVMESGRLLAQGPTRQLFAQPRQLAVAKLTGCKNLSPINWLSPQQCLASQWGLQIDEPRSPRHEQHHWVGLRANHLRLRPAGSTTTSHQLIVHSCSLVRVSRGALQVSAYVQIHAGATGIHVELRDWEWDELEGQRGALELVIDRSRILFLEA
ncbi:molybdate ABC transporter permease subunit [Synechococcus sp. CS-1325]|uniref:molybdate ABC transporter permease subunit n=1 Tax=Synechococcus sp. CS-1325 TaxID=2847979 RepID=UPI000DB8AE77|nr:molybdate ABC transporter permease subunit [Synechococcus sp. CS-1325]MCT0199022.1 molybdate ABC transporter permease subunit [Synechococcus sp. CS-1325]PZV00375.1 MAG: molybdate ABC transporter permease subunit [Cyanobium sp.]